MTNEVELLPIYHFSYGQSFLILKTVIINMLLYFNRYLYRAHFPGYSIEKVLKRAQKTKKIPLSTHA